MKKHSILRIGFPVIVLLSFLFPALLQATENFVEKEGVALTRNPFWPIGYTPSTSEEPEAAVAKEVSMLDLGLPEGRFSAKEVAYFQKQLTPKGIMAQGRKRFAIIQGDLMGEGDLARVRLNGKSYKFKLRTIKSSGVLLRYEADKPSPSVEETPSPRPTLRTGPLR